MTNSISTLEDRLRDILGTDKDIEALSVGRSANERSVLKRQHDKTIEAILTLFFQELSIVEKKAKIEGAEMLFQTIDAEYKSFAIDVGIGKILQKVREAIGECKIHDMNYGDTCIHCGFKPLLSTQKEPGGSGATREDIIKTNTEYITGGTQKTIETLIDQARHLSGEQNSLNNEFTDVDAQWLKSELCTLFDSYHQHLIEKLEKEKYSEIDTEADFAHNIMADKAIFIIREDNI